MTPTAQPGLVSGQTPTAVPGMVGGQTPTAQPGLASGQTPTAVPGMVSGQTPTAQPGLVSGQTPTAVPGLVSGQTPTAQPGLISGQTPTAQPGLVSGQTPTAMPGLVSGQTPTAKPGLVSGQMPTAQPGLVSGQTPTAHPPLVSGQTPLVHVTPTSSDLVCNHGWTQMMSVDSPSIDGNDLEPLDKLRKTYRFCDDSHIVTIRCAGLISDEEASQMGEKTSCDIKDGFRCYGADQDDGKCEDYAVQFYCDCRQSKLDLSRRTTNQQNVMCAQRRLRSAWASAQSDQSFCYVLNR